MIRNHAITVIALVQTLFICVGVALTGGIVKTFQDIGKDLDWNMAALAVKSHGHLLLVIPLAWTVFCLLMERRPAGSWTRRATLTTGMLLLAGICGSLGWTAMNPYHYQKRPIMQMGQ